MSLTRTDAPGFVRDDVGAVHNTNVGELEMVRALRRRSRERDDLVKRVERLESLVRELVDKCQ